MTNKTEEFINKAKEVHGDLYDYSKVEYDNNLKEVKIICKKHGDFLQTPKVHKKGSGCAKCSGKNKTTADFINESKEIYGDLYDYSNTNYINTKTKIKINCKTHGLFEITPNHHLSKGSGCQVCSRIEKTNKQRDTKEDFIIKAQQVHGNKYDYSNVNYISDNTPIIIICQIHGNFIQLPYVHKQGSGCQKCGKNYRTDTNEFIEKAKQVHGNKYNYSKVNYENSITDIIVICYSHGEFNQRPNNHLNGNGCAKCKFELIANLKRKTNKEFIEEANIIHNNLYDYSKVEYENANSNIIIICKEHGEFQQTPSHHINGNGCKKCSGNYTLTKDEFIEKANLIHNNKFIYTSINYVNNNTPIEIICKNHGTFLQIPYIHLKGHGCSKCSILCKSEKLIENNNFIEKATIMYNHKYNYSLVNYKGSNVKIKIICDIHGIFEKTPDNHLHKTNPQGCPKCKTNKQYSNAQIQWLNFIQAKDNIIIQHAENSNEYQIPNTKFKADGYCVETNIIYEYYGDYWHGNPNVFQCDEFNKTTKCTFGELYQKTLEREQQIRDMGFNLITIWESDWIKLNKCVRILQRKYRNSTLL